MNVTKAIDSRRAYRSLKPVKIKEDLIKDLARHAQLAPSCFNKQPWRFVFVSDPAKLLEMHAVLNPGNEWIHAASMIVAVFSRKEDDCLIGDREYYLFDCGLAAAFLILRATELGLVAHPIAGFNSNGAREILGIPEEYQVITLINIGRRSSSISHVLSKQQVGWEKKRPERFPFEKFVHRNHY